MNDPREIRVAVRDVWDEIVLPLDGSTPVREMKTLALAAARVTDDAAGYLVKFRGAELQDENQSLAGAGVPSGGAVIVMARRRRAVR